MDDNFGPEKKIMKFVPHLQEANRRSNRSLKKPSRIDKGQNTKNCNM
jgi:hypothetical protein